MLRHVRQLVRPARPPLGSEPSLVRTAGVLYLDALLRAQAGWMLLLAVARFSWRAAERRFAPRGVRPTSNEIWFSRLEATAAVTSVLFFTTWQIRFSQPDDLALAWVHNVARAAILALLSMAIGVLAVCLFLAGPTGREVAIADCKDQFRTAGWYSLTLAPFLAMPGLWHAVWSEDVSGLHETAATVVLALTSPAWFTFWFRASMLVGSHRFQTRHSGSVLGPVTALVLGILGLGVALMAAVGQGVALADPTVAAPAVGALVMPLVLIGLSWTDCRRRGQ